MSAELPSGGFVSARSLFVGGRKCVARKLCFLCVSPFADVLDADCGENARIKRSCGSGAAG